jgi:flagellar biosynthesis protein FliP
VFSVTASSAPVGGTTYSVPVQTLLIFTALSFLPAVLLMMTSFTRIVIALSLVRQALGLQATPPNQVIVGMSLLRTFLVMSPHAGAVSTPMPTSPAPKQKISFEDALNPRAGGPLRDVHVAAAPRGRPRPVLAHRQGGARHARGRGALQGAGVPAFVISEPEAPPSRSASWSSWCPS